MNALVKKEIRLLMSVWLTVLILAVILPWFWTDPDTAIGVFPVLFFFGMTILSVSSFGREFSQGTFLSLLSQPIERREIWRTKILVLFGAAVLILAVCMAGSALRLHLALADADSIWHANFNIIQDDFRNAMLASVAVLFVALASGLWTTLLLRQITSALWVSILTPVALMTLIVIIMTELFKSASDAAVETVIYCVAGVYFVSTFWLSRRLFYRAQDVGWSGGVITLPEWKWFGATSDAANLPRKRKPIFALLKKEFQLQQVSMIGAAGLFVLHLGVIVWRGVHTFEKDSAGEVLTSIFWMLWLIIPVVIGCMAVAEERKLGVMEGQLCLPVSRRLQFIVKGFFVLIVGTLLGGVLPLLMENIAAGIGVHNSMFTAEAHNEFGISLLDFSVMALAASLALVSFFASSLAKNFLQAIGFAIATVVVCGLMGAALTNSRAVFFNSISGQTTLPILIAVPTIVALLMWLSYLNFKNFRDGWRLLRRTILGFAGAFVFIVVMSIALYNRAWENFEPAEPPHGAAKFSLANPPSLRGGYVWNYQVQLPDGRIWIGSLEEHYYSSSKSFWINLWRSIASPLPKGDTYQFIAGSNWLSSATMQFGYKNGGVRTVGIQRDGSLWLLTETKSGDVLISNTNRLGIETNWQQTGFSPYGLSLLRNDGTLWRWDKFYAQEQQPAFNLKQVGAEYDWKEIYCPWPGYARKADGSVWEVNENKGKESLRPESRLDQVVFRTLSLENGGVGYVRPDGTLWVGYDSLTPAKSPTFGYLQVGQETNWLGVAVSYHMMVALKSDGSLWQWDYPHISLIETELSSPKKLGIHTDWVAINSSRGVIIALAADGTLWLWPDRRFYENGALLKLPKQPRLLGNVFGKSD